MTSKNTPDPQDRSSPMTSVIFRELEDAIARAQTLETSLKASQSALIRAQVEEETKLRLKNETERSSTHLFELQLQALKEDYQVILNRANERARALELKLKSESEKNAQLQGQLKAGAAKWDQLVKKVKTQNEQIANFGLEAANERRMLQQQLTMEKARLSVVTKEHDAEIAKLRSELEKLKRTAVAAPLASAVATPVATSATASVTAPVATPALPAKQAVASTFDRAQKQREQLAAMMKQSQARLAREKVPSNVQPIHRLQGRKALPSEADFDYLPTSPLDSSLGKTRDQ